MKYLPAFLSIIGLVIPSKAIADGLGGLKALDVVIFVYIALTITATVFIVWLIVSIKFIWLKHRAITNLKIILYSILSILLTAICMFQISSNLTDYLLYLFYLVTPLIVLITIFTLYKIIKIRKLVAYE